MTFAQFPSGFEQRLHADLRVGPVLDRVERVADDVQHRPVNPLRVARHRDSTLVPGPPVERDAPLRGPPADQLQHVLAELVEVGRLDRPARGPSSS